MCTVTPGLQADSMQYLFNPTIYTGIVFSQNPCSFAIDVKDNLMIFYVFSSGKISMISRVFQFDIKRAF